MRTASSSLLAFAALLVSCTSEYDLTGERPDVDPGEVTECGFTGVSGTYISSYDCNPVFTTTGEVQAADVGSVAFHTTEVLGHPFYQIWYVGFPEGGGYGTYSLGYAVSGDGTTWDTHPQNPLVASDGGMYQQRKSLKQTACRVCFVVVVSVVCTLHAYAGVVKIVLSTKAAYRCGSLHCYHMTY